jgi:hypothetical protein
VHHGTCFVSTECDVYSSCRISRRKNGVKRDRGDLSKNQQPEHGAVNSINLAVRRPLIGATCAAMDGDDPQDAGSVRIGCINVMSKSRVLRFGDVAALLTDGRDVHLAFPLVTDDTKQNVCLGSCRFDPWVHRQAPNLTGHE